MGNKYSYLTKNVILFSINGFLPKLLSLIFIPIYTSYLTTQEYGIFDLTGTTVSLLVPIFTLGIRDAVMRFALDENFNKSDVFSVALKIIFGGAVLVLLGTICASFLGIEELKTRYLIFFFIMYVVTALSECVSMFCRGIDRVKTMVSGGVLNSVVTSVSMVLFLVVFKLGLNGFFIANTTGSIASLVYCFFNAKLYNYIKLKVSKQVRNNMLAFSFPLIFSVISWWINGTSDRYILTWMSGVAVSGLYAVAYKIPNIMSVFQNIFTQAWSISAIKEFDKNDKDGFIGNMYTLMNFAMVAVCSAVMVCNPILARILYSNEFYAAWRFVPPLLVSVVFNSMALFVGGIFTAVKDTKTLSISTIVGAVVNTVCNFVLIYFWSAYGAAIATLIGHAVVLIMRRLILRKYIIMKVNNIRDLVVYGLLCIQMLIGVWEEQISFYSIIMFGIIILMYRKELGIVFRKAKGFLVH